MKLRPLAASTLGVGIIAASVLSLAGPALAAPPPGVTYVSASDIAGAPPFGSPGWGSSSGTPLTSTTSGLLMNQNTDLIYGLPSGVGLVGGSTLRTVANSSDYVVSDGSDFTPWITWYTDGLPIKEITLYALGDVSAFTDLSALWWTFVPVGSIAAFSYATLDQFDAAFALDPVLADATLEGVGLYNHGTPEYLTSFSTDGELFYFTPEPAPTAPTSIGQVDFGTTGLTATTTGFVPGEVVSAFLSTTQSVSDPIDLVADVNGAVSYTWIAPVTYMDLGTYDISFVGSASGTMQFFDFDVLAQALAATGVDASASILAAGALLLAGAALTVVATRSRERAA